MLRNYQSLICSFLLFLCFIAVLAAAPETEIQPTTSTATDSVSDSAVGQGQGQEQGQGQGQGEGQTQTQSVGVGDGSAKANRKVVNYKMTEIQYCSACHSLVEEFYRWTLTNLQMNNMNLSFSHAQLMDLYCRQSQPFSDVFQDFYQQACLKIIQDHHTVVLSPFMGQHKAAEFLVLNEVYAHKIAVCEQIGACRPLPASMLETSSTSYSDCEKCERLVYTGEKLLRREKLNILNETRVRNYVNALCQEIGLHFHYPLDLEEYCRDQHEEYGQDLQQKFVDFFISDSYQERTTQALATESGAPAVVLLSHTSPILKKSVCVHLTGHCAKTKEEKKEHKEHEKERLENLRKRKAKNPFAPKVERSKNNRDQL